MSLGEERFFSEQSENSFIKTKIVTEYFKVWASIMTNNLNNPKYCKGDERLYYIDLYSGKGVYDNGDISTPLEILEILQDDKIRKYMHIIFNEKRQDYFNELKENVQSHPTFKLMQDRIQLYNKEVDSDFAREFHFTTDPKFLFLDPFGYKGLAINSIGEALRSFGSDGAIFFNYNRINQDIDKPSVKALIDFVFGIEKAKEIRSEIKKCVSDERELFIVEHFADALKAEGLNFIVKFRFMKADMSRPSHYLIFVSKHIRGYEVMKETLHKATNNDGFGYFEFNPKLGSCGLTLDNFVKHNQDDLSCELLYTFAGRKMTVEDVYKRHHVGTNYILDSYRKVLKMLAYSGKIEVSEINSKGKRCRIKSEMLDKYDIVRFKEKS